MTFDTFKMAFTFRGIQRCLAHRNYSEERLGFISLQSSPRDGNNSKMFVLIIIHNKQTQFCFIWHLNAPNYRNKV